MKLGAHIYPLNGNQNPKFESWADANVKIIHSKAFFEIPKIDESMDN